MNASKIFAVAALAAVASFGAHADEADGSQSVLKFEGTRTRAEVNAEAVKEAARPNSNIPSASLVAAPVKSNVDRAVIRAQAAEAVRLGQIGAGELGNTYL